jgi:predicted NUDIX family phosphoesterase
MNKVNTELILCCSNSRLDNLNGGFTKLVDKELAELFERKYLWFGPRVILENDSKYKQIIPYIVIKHKERIVLYKRAKHGEERRLHNHYSIGLGGHIQISDAEFYKDNIRFIQTLEKAANREVAEESIINTIIDKKFLGLIIDNTNDVGRHHIGILYVWESEKPVIISGEKAVADCKFVAVKSIIEQTALMESWSQIALNTIIKENI